MFFLRSINIGKDFFFIFKILTCSYLLICELWFAGIQHHEIKLCILHGKNNCNSSLCIHRLLLARPFCFWLKSSWPSQEAAIHSHLHTLSTIKIVLQTEPCQPSLNNWKGPKIKPSYRGIILFLIKIKEKVSHSDHSTRNKTKHKEYLKHNCRLTYSEVSKSVLYWKHILFHTGDIILVF